MELEMLNASVVVLSEGNNPKLLKPVWISPCPTMKTSLN